MTAVLDRPTKAPTSSRPREVCIVDGELTEANLLQMMTREGKERSSDWLTVRSVSTSAIGPALIDELMSVEKVEMIEVHITDFDIGLDCYIGTVRGHITVFFTQRDGHWLIFPRFELKKPTHD